MEVSHGVVKYFSTVFESAWKIMDVSLFVLNARKHGGEPSRRDMEVSHLELNSV